VAELPLIYSDEVAELPLIYSDEVAEFQKKDDVKKQRGDNSDKIPALQP
jgi:hypothetical protein